MRIQIRDFRFRFGICSIPKLLFRFLFRMRLGRSIRFPWASRSFGERAWWRMSQQRLLVDGLHTKTIPGTSRVHPAHMVEGWDLQSGIIHRDCYCIRAAPFSVYVWYGESLGRTGTHDNSIRQVNSLFAFCLELFTCIGFEDGSRKIWWGTMCHILSGCLIRLRLVIPTAIARRANSRVH